MPAAAHPPTDSALDHALALVELGLRPVPIKPGGKHPPMASWQHAQPDEALVRNWYRGLYRDCGVGLVMGPQPCGITLAALDVDAHNPAQDGWEALSDLQARYGMPDTWQSLTGGGGAHILFSVPAGITVRNQQAGGNRIAPGIDVRGDGGQIVVAPTIHPGTGRPYAWENAPWDGPIAECPAWLLTMVREKPVMLDAPTSRLYEPNTRPTNTNSDTQSPANALRERWDWRHELTAAGWTLAKDGHDSLWTRPGKSTRDGHSAVLHGNEVLVVFTTDIPPGWTQAGVRTADGSGWSFSPFAFYAATRHGGDQRAAGRELRGDTWTEKLTKKLTNDEFGALADSLTSEDRPADTDDDWAPHDIVAIGQAILDGTLEPELPTILRVDGGMPLLYPGRIHSVFGTPGGGKSWVGIYAILETVRDGQRCGYIDWEDSSRGFVGRLVELGATPDELALVDYFNPSTSLLYGWQWVQQRMAEWALVVIDSTGEAMASGGVKANEDDAVAMWMAQPKQLARAGAAVLLIDHVPKNPDNQDMEIGSQRKQAAVTGAAYRVDTIKEPAKGRDGLIKLVVRKDRLGNRAKKSTACEVAFHSTGERLALQFRVSDAQAAAERGETFRPTRLMENVSRWLEGCPGASRRDIEASVRGKGAAIRQAIDVLIFDGYVEAKPTGPAGTKVEHTVIRPFRETEPVDNWIGEGTASHRVPPRPTASRDAVQPQKGTASPASPSLSRRGRGTRSLGEQEDAPRPDEIQPPEPVDNSRRPPNYDPTDDEF